MAGSMCDRCYNPGQCCSEFNLKGGKAAYGTNKREARRRLAKMRDEGGRRFPFQPDHYRKDLDIWIWNCSKLGSDGRCMVYENRPDPCRGFEPASRSLCVHFKGAESLGNEHFGENIYSDTVMKWGQ